MSKQDHFTHGWEGLMGLPDESITHAPIPDLNNIPQNTKIFDSSDGGMIVDFNPQDPSEMTEYIHGENLALKIPKERLNVICGNLIKAIDDDYNSASEWRLINKQGIEQLGLKIDEGSYPFKGCNKTYSAAYTKACMSFIAGFRSEMLPAAGPVDTKIYGDTTPELEDSAERRKSFGNYYLTEDYKDYYSEKEKIALWAWISGAGFSKVYQDPTNMGIKPLAPCIKPDDLIVNYGAPSLRSASRITHRFKLTYRELKQRQLTGFYVNDKISPYSSMMSGDNVIDDTIDQVTGFRNQNLDNNTICEMYECHEYIDLKKSDYLYGQDEETGRSLPYIVTIDKQSNTILAIYRNWREGDPEYTRLNSFVQYPLLPGFSGVYCMGMAALASGSAKAASQIKRQLIDAGVLANFPGGVKAKGLRLDSSDFLIGPTEFKEVDTGGRPIQDVMMPLPYRDPSPILKELKDDIENDIMQLAGINDMQLADFNQNAPVGTTIALLEQSHKMQSSIISRMHQALTEEFELIFKIVGDMLPPDMEYPFMVQGGNQVIMKSDFSDQIRVVPISDPNNNSSTLRIAKAEAIYKLANTAPQLHDMYEVYYDLYKSMAVANIDKILKKPAAPQELQPLDPITENQLLLKGQPIKAFIFQDHDAYIGIRQSFIETLDPNQYAMQIQAANANITDHRAFAYQLQMEQMLGQQLPDDPAQLPPEMQNQIAQSIFQALQQQKQQKEAENPPPLDPSQVMVMDIEQRAENQRNHNELEKYKADLKADIDKFKTEVMADIKLKELYAKGIV